MKFKQLFIAIAISFSSQNWAAFLDLREEYNVGTKSWVGRVWIKNEIDRHSFSAEVRASGNLSELSNGYSEFIYGYKLGSFDQWLVSTSIPITLFDNSVTYKPQISGQYSFNSGVIAKLRYRHEFRNYADEAMVVGRDGEVHDSYNASKLTGNLDYKWAYLKLGFEMNFKQDFIDKRWKLGTNERYEWDYNVKLGYKPNEWQWRPYFELGNVQCTSTLCDSSRQLRARVGATYFFSSR
ncbi:oligogalacturonate-specific porin KdgM family protein [Vibrio hyugaensis]|uniref:oligogalacturonate-specific porin KdgM family protein n=1 Tax=Vibrio hyugaensis TaxID=1534743 RepID=UPI0005EF0D6A|nr:oligogalacturonate-specific porin KdgM family protein [Vibrio hyugaensis]